MNIKCLASVAVLFLFCLPGHSDMKPSEKYASAVALVETPENKMKCTRAAVALDGWQERLKVQDWSIELICGPYENLPGSFGITEILPAPRMARMWINIELDMDPESVVIHELLHLVMQRIDSRRGEEQTVWMLGQLLYEGRRCIK